jgi:manganese-dependent inorganic pyrophosphatase
MVRKRAWNPQTDYVVGHQRPDMDAVASAAAYAWLLSQEQGKEVVAARAGAVPPQATFAFSRFDWPIPKLISSVAPTFGLAGTESKPVRPESPLSAGLECLDRGYRVVPVVYPSGRPVGVVTPLALARAFARGEFSRTCGVLAQDVPALGEDERISDHRSLLLRGEHDDYLITDSEGRYSGLITRAVILEPPRARLILVDHNELGQAVSGAEEAEIVAVLDHHRLGNPGTTAPIPFVVDPVGSTCTLVAERCRAGGHNPPAPLAGLMLSGILSDTLLFRSPTTTPRDEFVGEWLSGLAKVDVEEYGRELLSSGSGLSGEPKQILDHDRKSYEMSGRKVAIAQVEVGTLDELPQRFDPLREALKELCNREGLALGCLMVTDVVRAQSRLVCAGEPALIRALPFSRLRDGLFELGNMVSRKKQLVPLLEDLLKGASG